MVKIKAIIKFLLNKIEGKQPLKTTFINRPKPTFKSFYPKDKLSYNEIVNSITNN